MHRLDFSKARRSPRQNLIPTPDGFLELVEVSRKLNNSRNRSLLLQEPAEASSPTLL